LGSAPLSASSSLGSSAAVRRRVSLTPTYVLKQSPRVACRSVLPPPLRMSPRSSPRSWSYDGSELFEQPASVAEARRSSMGPVSRVQASGKFPVGLDVPRMHSWASSAGPDSSSVVASPAKSDTICFLAGDDLMHAVGRQEHVQPDLEEYLSGSPWDSCEDIAHDDLVDWFMEFSHIDSSRRTPSLVKELMSLLQEEQGKAEDVEEMKEMEDVPRVSSLLDELGNVSTASSLRSAFLAASSCSSMASPSKSTSQVSKQTDSSLASESEWELEFIIRGVLDLHARTEFTEVERGSRRAWSGASKTFEGALGLNASELAEAEWFAVLTEQSPASSTPPDSSRRPWRWQQEAEIAEVDGLIWA